jgi:thymidylate kinase
MKMILSEEYLQWLLDQAIPQASLPADYGVVLEGSIAEGFGNESSDIDLLFLCDDDYDYPTMPSVLFIDGRRVEVRTRSLSQVTEQADDVLRLAAGGPRGLARLSVDLLNRCQRITCSFPLRNSTLVRKAQSALPASRLPEIVSAWSDQYACQAMRLAVAMNAMDQADEAAAWARTALAQAAKAWVAAAGQTYIEPKWLPQQLARSGRAGDDLVERFWTLTRDAHVPARGGSYVAACAALVRDFGVNGCPPEPSMVTVSPERRVTTWQVGTRLHVIRGRQDVFALGSQAAAVWRSIDSATPLPGLLARAGDSPAVAGGILAQFYHAGLVRLRWRNGGTISLAQPYAPGLPSNPPPSTAMPILGLGGAVMPDEGAVLALVPMPAKRFATAAMAHIWSNIMIENAREDLEGAMAQEQWQVAEISVRRALVHACRALLSSYGVSPPPPDSAIVGRLRQLPHVPRHLVGLADEISTGSSRIESRQAATTIADSLGAFVREAREVSGASSFPGSFESEDQWRRTLAIGYDWIRIGAYLDSEFPIEEARDLFNTGGAQPHVRESLENRINNNHGRGLSVFIALEGIDGAGKTKTAGLLVDILRERGMHVTFAKHNATEAADDYTAAYLTDLRKVNERYSEGPYFRLGVRHWIFMRAGYYALVDHCVVTPALDAGHLVIADGWYYKFAARIAAARPDAGDTGMGLDQVLPIFNPVRVPDRVFLIDVPAGVAVQRKDSFNEGELGPQNFRANDRVKAFTCFQASVRQYLLSMSRANRWQTIDGTSGVAMAIAEVISAQLGFAGYLS